MKLHGVVLAFFVSALAGPGLAQSEQGITQSRAMSPTAKADALLAAFTKDKPGLSVLVAREGKPVYERISGMADLEQGTPATAATRFHLASVSKQFTAFAVLQLAKAGKVDLNADIHTYLPELADYGAKITVSDLVHHTSGLRDQWELEILSGTSLDSLIRQKALMAMAVSQKALNFAPGTEWRYSNTNYVLLAEIVARTSGLSFKQYMRERVFDPLGMKDTFVYDNANDLMPNRAVSYFFDPAGVAHLIRLNYSNYGPTSVNSTARDLMKWSDELLHPKVFDAALVRSAEEPGRLRDGRALHYAFGMARMTVGGHSALTHTGADAAYRTLIASFPAEDATVVVLSSGNADVGKIADELTDAFLGVGAAAPPVVPAELERITALAGYYANDWAPGFDLRIDGDKLVRGQGPARREAKFLKDGDFYFGDPSDRFHRRPDGVLEEQNVVSGLPVIHRPAKRVTPQPADLGGIAGVYHSDELDVTYRVSVVGNGLMFSSLRSDPMPFFPADANHFENPQVRIAILRDPSGKVFGLTVATGRVRDLRFSKTG
jgi:CubicO group peptidase (beta-lactamase class C family)